MSAFSISFGTPKHGWLGVQLAVGESQVEFSASDVLNNPVDDLLDAIRTIFAGREAAVWFFLEPGGYWLEFRPINGALQLALVFSESGQAKDRQTVIVQHVPVQSAVRSIWKAIQHLQSLGPQKPAWPATNQEQLNAVQSLLRSEG